MTEYDITKGFTYMYLYEKPLFAFGRGLSYTSFDYSNLNLSSAQVGSDGTVQIQRGREEQPGIKRAMR